MATDDNKIESFATDWSGMEPPESKRLGPPVRKVVGNNYLEESYYPPDIHGERVIGHTGKESKRTVTINRFGPTISNPTVATTESKIIETYPTEVTVDEDKEAA